MRQLELLKLLKLLDGGSVRDLRQVRRLVLGRMLKEDVGDGDEDCAREEEDSARDGGEAEPSGSPRPAAISRAGREAALGR